MNLKFDENQQFIFNQIKFGLSNKPTPEPMTDIDIERLKWPEEYCSKLPIYEWNEWSRKIHWALQYAFIQDTSSLENKEKLMEWRKKCLAIIKSALSKGKGGQIILESSTLHFVQKDLLHYLIDVYSFKNFTDEEKKIISILIRTSNFSTKKGCLASVFVFISFAVLTVFGILMF
ncbi:hypothetical protein JW964_03070 [candidate division KSB1 bacterium]|nr:hypothetical protein [candidate division KSB1 bacterium]